MIMYANAPRRDRLTRMHGFEPAPSAVQRSMPLLLEEMDRAGVAAGVVVGRLSGLFGSVTNDDVAKIAADHPGRFVAVGSIDPTDRDGAISEITRVAGLGFRAINIEPASYAVPMKADDRRLYPIYAHCEGIGIPVIIMAGGSAGPDLSYTEPAHLDRVAADFPELRIVVSHGGWPWVHQVLHIAYRRPNLYVSPDQYLANMPGMNDYVAAADGFLSDRFLYGSSYPFTPVDRYAEWFRTLPIRPESMEKVLFRNAADLLRLDLG
ncbi:amidohydrolase [Rhizobiales bacterium L72]|uniref:Amidohydrolase n=2 Tax=Propylenella binzhouense TaxID=2555902 RepID=A0A964WT35_9HYPH|nr:amidohydrolase [Propylenella binzhouense]